MCTVVAARQPAGRQQPPSVPPGRPASWSVPPPRSHQPEAESERSTATIAVASAARLAAAAPAAAAPAAAAPAPAAAAPSAAAATFSARQAEAGRSGGVPSKRVRGVEWLNAAERVRSGVPSGWPATGHARRPRHRERSGGAKHVDEVL